jgi:hypothetical protein
MIDKDRFIYLGTLLKVNYGVDIWYDGRKYTFEKGIIDELASDLLKTGADFQVQDRRIWMTNRQMEENINVDDYVEMVGGMMDNLEIDGVKITSAEGTMEDNRTKQMYHFVFYLSKRKVETKIGVKG